jgi:2',3'-cyclic-nucleotide 2'-phosphodiesterase (5'-nucleotidase family)
MDVPIGTLGVELDSRNATVRTREAAIGNLFTDAMRSATHSDAAIINGGGIRAGKVYPLGGTLRRKDILAELPFNNRVVVVELSGADLLAAVENGLSALPLASGRFPQVAGLKIEFDAGRPAGQRVLTIAVAGMPLDRSKDYRVAILDFLARGGDNYTTLRDARRITPDNDAPLLATEVISYVERLGTVRTGVEGRILGR